MTSFDSHSAPTPLGEALQDKANQRLGWALGGSLLGNLLLWRLVSAIAASHPPLPPKPIEITRLVVSARGTRTVKVVNRKAVARRVAQLKRTIAAHPERFTPPTPPRRQPIHPQPARPHPRIVTAPQVKAPTDFRAEPTAAPQAHNEPTAAPSAPQKTGATKPHYAANPGGNTSTRGSNRGAPNGPSNGSNNGPSGVGDPNGTNGPATDPSSKGTTTAPAPTDPPPPPPTATPRPEPTNTPLPPPTATPKPEPTNTPRPAPTATPKPAPTATPKPAPTATPKPKGATRDAQISKQVDVDIPDDLKDEEFKKSVRVRVDVAADGSATPSLRGSSGNARVDDLVLAALRRWKWKPALKDGEAVASTQYFRFDIEVR